MMPTRRMTDLPGARHAAGRAVSVLAPARRGGHAPFDLVLCDVPCSGSGTWRRTPDAKWRLTPGRPGAPLPDPGDILDAAWGWWAGGVLVYATCSVLRSENEDRVAAFRTRHPGAAVRLTAPVAGGAEGGDGFFLSRISRQCDPFCNLDGIAGRSLSLV